MQTTTPAKRPDMKPVGLPSNPRFSSGPCAKPPVFSLDKLADAALGRSPRAAVGKAKLKAAIDTTRAILGVPEDYRIGIVPASDTGAMEMALWSLLGERPAEMVAWESFGAGWVTDVVKQLKIEATTHTADDPKAMIARATVAIEVEAENIWPAWMWAVNHVEVARLDQAAVLPDHTHRGKI